MSEALNSTPLQSADIPQTNLDAFNDRSSTQRSSSTGVTGAKHGLNNVSELSHDGLIALPQACIDELDEVVGALRMRPGFNPTSLRTDEFALDACADLMRVVNSQLDDGIGYAVIDRVPVERYTTEESKAVAWLLASLHGPIVEQSYQGTRLYDVKDTGKALKHGVRRSVTNKEQGYHTDGAWLHHAPGFVGLFCIQQAAQGGLSKVVSLEEAHRYMERKHPALLKRLYRPFCWDRQAEHGGDAAPVSRHPVFERRNGSLTVRYYENYIVEGYKLAGERLDELGRAALATLRTVLNEQCASTYFRLQAGQFQYVNNHRLAHARAAFKNGDSNSSTRHLLRIWNRFEGDETLEGDATLMC